MRNALRWMVAVAVMLAFVPSMASAENFYAAVRGGPSWIPDTFTGIPGGEDRETWKLGFTGSGAIGYRFAFGLRAEGEFGFIYGRPDRDGGVEVSGSLKDYLMMANLYYDLRIPALGPFTPYVGAGLGVARENRDMEAFFDTAGRKFDVDNWRTAFAYQARAGIIYDVNKWLDLSAGYRYIHVEGGQQTFGTARVNFGGLDNHSIELGFAVKF
jgi:opacity protein-like surface antigen